VDPGAPVLMRSQAAILIARQAFLQIIRGSRERGEIRFRVRID
jgi:hypothetical protein